MRQDFTSFFSVLCDGFGDPIINFRLICDDKRKNKPVLEKQYALSDIMDDVDVYSELLELNREQGYGIFHVVNDGGGSDDKITSIRALFIDSDGILSLNKFLQVTTNLPPHLLIETSLNRFHAYWLVHDCSVSKFTEYQKLLAGFFSADAKSVNLSRLMRTPGFLNQKPEYKLSKLTNIYKSNLSPAYSVRDVLSHYSSIPTIDTPTVKSNLQKLKQDGLGQGERNQGLFSYGLYLFGLGLNYEDVCQLVFTANKNKCNPPLADREVMQLITSAQKSKIANEAMNVLAKDIKLDDLITSTDDIIIPHDTILDIAYATARDVDHIHFPLPPNKDCLVNQIYKYLMETCFETTHELGLAAALSYVGATKGHTCRSYTNARTNLFILALAPSGTGKTEVRNRLFQITFSAGIKNFNLSNPASEAGFLESLNVNKRRFLAWDEFGLRLATLTQGRSATYESGIIPFILEIFSSAGSVFYDKTRRGNKPKILDTENASEAEIPYPHLGVLAISTPETFYKAVSLANIDDGFIPRFIPILSPHTKPRRLTEQRHEILNMKKYQHIIDQCTFLHTTAMFTPDDSSLAPGELPFEKRFTDEAFEEWAEYQYQCRLMSVTRFTPIWLRAAEHAMKVALTISDGNRISLQDCRWAIGFVNHSLKAFVGQTYKEVTDNTQSLVYLKLLQFIASKQETGGASRADIMARFTKMPEFKQYDLLQSAIDAGAIEYRLITNPKRGKALERYTISEKGLEEAKKIQLVPDIQTSTDF